MATLATLVVKLRAEIGDFVKSLDDAERQTAKFGRQMTSTGRNMTEGLTLPLVGAGALFFKFAADAEVTDRRFGLAFGSMSAQARTFSEQLASRLGLSGEEIRKAMTPAEQAFRDMGLSAGTALQMSEGLVKLAEDLSVTSGAGKSMDEIMQQLVRSLSGSSRGLKDLGIVIDQPTVKAYALQHGLLGLHETMSTGTRAIITYQMILAQTANLQGSFARNLTDPLVMLRQLKEGAGDVARELGTSLMPAFQAILGWAKQLADHIKRLADWFRGLSQGLKDTIVYVGLAVAAIGPLVFVWGKVIAGIAGLLTILGMLKNVLLAAVLTPVGQVVLALGALTWAVVQLVPYTNWMKEQVYLAWTTVRDVVLQAVAGVLLGVSQVARATGFTELADRLIGAYNAVRGFNEKMLANSATTIFKMEQQYDALGRNIRRAFTPPAAPAPAGAVGPTGNLTGTANASNLRTQAERIGEALRLMNEHMTASRMEANLLGTGFNEAAAYAQELQTAFKAIAATGATADQVLDKNGLTLRKLGKEYADATTSGKRYYDFAGMLNAQIARGITSMAAAIGQSIATGGNVFAALGKSLLGSLGAVATAVGEKLIEMGSILVKVFAAGWNPFVMIAAGAALVALGSIISATATSAYSGGGGGGYGGGFSSASAPIASSNLSGQGGPITIEVQGGSWTLNANNPRQVDEFAHMLLAVQGRNVGKIILKKANS